MLLILQLEETRYRHSSNLVTTTDVQQTVCLLESMFYALSLNPATQRKAQENIDRVVGHTRLPDLSDQELLPYVTAIVKEGLR